MITLTDKNSFDKTRTYLKKRGSKSFSGILEKYGRRGVALLRSATPSDSGKTADSWDYKVEVDKNGISLVFENSNIQNGVPVVILLIYGHGTRSGGYVKGTDFVSPAVKPLFKEIADEAWKEVTKL